MKHEILEEIWRIRDKISAECGHDLKRLAALMREEAGKFPDRLVRLPIRRKTSSRRHRVAHPAKP